MAAQQNLFDTKMYIIQGAPKIPKKRVHYKKPAFNKTYKFYHTNPYTNELEYDGDEKHIFRIKDLQKIHSQLYSYGDIPLFTHEERITKCGLVFYPEDMQAEIENTWHLPIKTRVLLHIKLLRQLRNGVELEKAVLFNGK